MAKKKARRPSSSRKRGLPIGKIIGILLVLLAVYLVRTGWLDSDVLEEAGIDTGDLLPTVSPLPQQSSGAIEVFFTTPTLRYPDRADSRRAPPFEQRLVADIDAAQEQVELVTFEYNLPSVADALVRAQQRGVAVRLALDEESLEDPDDAEWAGRVQDAGIPIAWETSSGFLHSKFVVIDRAVVWTGSWNITTNDTYRNNNNLLRITIPAIVDNYHAEFRQMFEHEAFGTSKNSLSPSSLVETDDLHLENYFSPQDGIETYLIERLTNAQQSIRFMAFSYTSDPIADVMIARHNNGVDVRGVFEMRNSGGTGAEFDRLARAGIEVLEDGNCYTMHHKVIIIDDETVITGSYNFTRRAEETNDENVVIIDDPTLAGYYLQEFDRVYAQAQHPTQCGQ